MLLKLILINIDICIGMLKHANQNRFYFQQNDIMMKPYPWKQITETKTKKKALFMIGIFELLLSIQKLFEVSKERCFHSLILIYIFLFIHSLTQNNNLKSIFKVLLAAICFWASEWVYNVIIYALYSNIQMYGKP